MIDYFALLDQPRAPWLDLEELKNTYHRKTLVAHPDNQASRPATENTGEGLTSLNEAYQVLGDPKRRLHHLLSLEGREPSSSDQTFPEQLHDLFPAIGTLTKRTKSVLEHVRATSNALSRALLKPQILEAQNEANAVYKKIQALSDASLEELRQINETWTKNPAEQIEDLTNLYFIFAYLNRWAAQLDEMIFQLSLL